MNGLTVVTISQMIQMIQMKWMGYEMKMLKIWKNWKICGSYMNESDEIKIWDEFNEMKPWESEWNEMN